MLASKAYHFCDSAIYFIPDCDNVHSIRDYISSLPLFDRPEAFGQHTNAHILKQIVETNKMAEALMLTKPQAVSQASSKDQKVLAIVADVLRQLPAPIDVVAKSTTSGTAIVSPVRVAVNQEVARYNALLIVMAESLEGVAKAIHGTAMITAELEQISSNIYEGKVPVMWLNFYPSVKQLGSWMRDLVQRVAYFREFSES